MRRLITLLLGILLPLCPVLAQSADPDVIEFAFITDTHKWGPTADIRFADNNIKAFVKYCNDHPSIQFALHGGDFMNAYDTKHEQALFCLEHGMNDFSQLRIPLYTTKGNHDCNGKQRDSKGRRDNSQIITDHEYFERCNPLSPRNPLQDTTGIVVDASNREGNYYYRDFPQQRFRLIVLNDYDLDSLEFYGYHGAQMKWLAEQALDFTPKANPSDWSFLIIGHGFGFNMFMKPISRLLHAYTAGQDFTDSDRGYSYHCQYDKVPRAKLVALIGGHNHEDLYDNPDGYNILHINRGFATGGEIGDAEQELCFDHFILNTREKTLYEHRIGRGRDHLFRYDPGYLVSPTPAFPEAMGMGGFTTGGTEGRTYWVTNLNDSGQGSLRWAISQPGCRLVCFKVSGDIQLRSPLVIDHDSITIAGHSAPGEGIALHGQNLQILASNVIIRYLRLRGCPLTDGDFGQTDLLIDHLSCSFTEGPAISIRRAKNVTVQNCLVSHTRGDAIMAGGYMSTYYRNLITSCPNALHVPDNEGENRWIHLYRNVIDNWQQYAMYGGGRGGEMTIEENFLRPGPATVNKQMLTVAPDGTGRYYTNGNGYNGNEDIRDQWGLVDDRLGMPYDPAPSEIDHALRARMDRVALPSKGDFASTCLVIAAFHYRGLFTRPTKTQTWREALLTAGCSKVRDGYDNRLIDNLRAGRITGEGDGLFTTERNVGGLPSLRKRSYEPSFGRNNLSQQIDALVTPDRSIVILYDCDIHGDLGNYPLLAGYRDAISINADSCHVGIVSLGDYLDADSTDEDAVTVGVMGKTRYDAIALGGNELQRPIDALEKTLKPTFYNVTNCVLTRSLEYASAEHRRIFKPYVLYSYGRRQVAFIGISQTANPDDAVQLVQQSINRARQEGASYIVLLSNMSNDPRASRRSYSAEDLIRRIEGADVVLDSAPDAPAIESQQLTDKAGRNVVLSRLAHGFSHIGKLIIAPDGLITTELISNNTLRFKSPSVTEYLDQNLRP